MIIRIVWFLNIVDHNERSIISVVCLWKWESFFVCTISPLNYPLEDHWHSHQPGCQEATHLHLHHRLTDPPYKKGFLRFGPSDPLCKLTYRFTSQEGIVLGLASQKLKGPQIHFTRRDFLGSGPLILCASWLTDPPHNKGFLRFAPSDPLCKLTYRSTSQEGIS